MNKYLLAPVFLLCAAIAGAQQPLLGEADTNGIVIPMGYSFKQEKPMPKKKITQEITFEFDNDIKSMYKYIEINRNIAAAKKLIESVTHRTLDKLAAEDINYDTIRVRLSKNSRYFCQKRSRMTFTSKPPVFEIDLAPEEIIIKEIMEYNKDVITITEEIDANLCRRYYADMWVSKVKFNSLSEKKQSLFIATTAENILKEDMSHLLGGRARHIFDETILHFLKNSFFEKRYAKLLVKYPNPTDLMDSKSWATFHQIKCGNYYKVLDLPLNAIVSDFSDVIYIVSSKEFKEVFLENFNMHYETFLSNLIYGDSNLLHKK